MTVLQYEFYSLMMDFVVANEAYLTDTWFSDDYNLILTESWT
jgi:hypothetical protein